MAAKILEMMPAGVRARALRMATMRAGIGVASICAPSASARIAGFPAAHANPSARLMARLFGVRELLLAWLVFDAVRGGDPAPSVFVLQAAVDAADVAAQSVSVIKGDGIARGAISGMALAGGAAVLWGQLARKAARKTAVR